MRLLFAVLAFSFSAEAAVPQTNGCERAEAGLLQENGASALEEELAARERGGLSEEPPFSDCRAYPGLKADFLNELGEEEGYIDSEQEKSCKTALDDYSKSEIMTASLPAAVIISIGASIAILVKGCSNALERHRERISKDWEGFKPGDSCYGQSQSSVPDCFYKACMMEGLMLPSDCRRMSWQ